VLCTTGSWSVENSGFPEIPKIWRVAKGPLHEWGGLAGGACDLIAVRWDVPKYRPGIEKFIARWGFKDIPALTK